MEALFDGLLDGLLDGRREGLLEALLEDLEGLFEPLFAAALGLFAFLVPLAPFFLRFPTSRPSYK